MPADVQAKIRQATLKAMAQPAVQARLAELGTDAGSGARIADRLAKSLRATIRQAGRDLARGWASKPQDLGG